MATVKVGFISDLHCGHWVRAYAAINPVNDLVENIEKEKPDLILDAGDYEMPINFPCQYVSIPGNHDYYGKSWQEMLPVPSVKKFEFRGLKIAMATLWTNFNNGNQFAMGIYRRDLADCSCITGFNPQLAYDIHREHVKFLEQCIDQDIIVTHHVPTFAGIHKRYKFGYRENSQQYNVNYGFASHLDSLIRELKPKVWHFGHTHDNFDFKIDNTRMLCNPLGYPSEYFNLRGWEPYKPVYIKFKVKK